MITAATTTATAHGGGAVVVAGVALLCHIKVLVEYIKLCFCAE